MDGVTLLTADTMNDLNRLNYTIFGDPATVSAARLTLLAGMDKITNSLGADVALNNQANYFDGPSVAQATAGTWFVSGAVTLQDTSIAAAFHIKLWDGTTVIDSAVATSGAANAMTSGHVSGFITTPAGNLRISVKDPTSASGKIIFNVTGSSKDSTITAIRIG